MARSLHELAATLGLQVQGLDLEIQGVASLELAGGHDLSFLSGPKHAPLLDAPGPDQRQPLSGFCPSLAVV